MRFLPIFSIYFLFATSLVAEDACQNSFALTNAPLQGQAGENQFDDFVGYYNVALVEAESGEIVFGTTTYLSANSHKQIISMIAQLHGPIRNYLFLGEIYKSPAGIERIINTSGFSTTIPAEQNHNSSENLVKYLKERTQFLAPKVEVLTFDQDIPGRRHLDPHLDELGSGNVRHELNDCLHPMSMILQLLENGVEMDAELSGMFYRSSAVLEKYLDLLRKGTIWKADYLVRLKGFTMQVVDHRKILPGDYAKASADLKTLVEVLRTPPILLLTLPRPPAKTP